MTRSAILQKILEEWREKRVRNEADLIFAQRRHAGANLQNLPEGIVKAFKSKIKEIEGAIQRCDAFVDIIKEMMCGEDKKPKTTEGEA